MYFLKGLILNEFVLVNYAKNFKAITSVSIPEDHYYVESFSNTIM